MHFFGKNLDETQAITYHGKNEPAQKRFRIRPESLLFLFKYSIMSFLFVYLDIQIISALVNIYC